MQKFICLRRKKIFSFNWNHRETQWKVMGQGTALTSLETGKFIYGPVIYHGRSSSTCYIMRLCFDFPSWEIPFFVHITITGSNHARLWPNNPVEQFGEELEGPIYTYELFIIIKAWNTHRYADHRYVIRCTQQISCSGQLLGATIGPVANHLSALAITSVGGFPQIIADNIASFFLLNSL